MSVVAFDVYGQSLEKQPWQDPPMIGSSKDPLILSFVLDSKWLSSDEVTVTFWDDIDGERCPLNLSTCEIPVPEGFASMLSFRMSLSAKRGAHQMKTNKITVRQMSPNE